MTKRKFWLLIIAAWFLGVGAGMEEKRQPPCEQNPFPGWKPKRSDGKLDYICLYAERDKFYCVWKDEELP